MKATMFKAFCTMVITACSGSVALAQEAGDPEKGEKVFRKCKACHEVGPDAKSKTGPVLNGIVGRDAATYEEFSYSDAMLAAGEGGLVWTPEALAEFLEKPKDFVDGTKMTFAGLRKDDERADVIAYLATFN